MAATILASCPRALRGAWKVRTMKPLSLLPIALAASIACLPFSADARRVRSGSHSSSHSSSSHSSGGSHGSGAGWGAMGQAASHSSAEATAARQALGSIGESAAYREGRFTALLPEASRAQMVRPSSLMSGLARPLDAGLSPRAQALLPPGLPRKSKVAAGA
jgi:hypothetical protein